ncbi:type II secretion system major pseudopilin GspG [Sphingosinithalassobacter sp. CS137]|uniref:type II secretion system major pseudopilin GspG n=1 Tax=Sphingosinithalassobacter sp. CS137 TaxID=2762748 RepID=UPI00165D773E|nr:type II secretion system major pseudopilin GspG [Sphingosinithalassobacter sp. CS137]
MKQFRDSVASAARARKRRAASQSEAGLTLVEMMVVLVIIALVAALIVPNVIGRPDQARVTTATSNLATISQALTMYRLDNGDYPSTQQGLKALVERPSVPPVPANWAQGGYLTGLQTNDQGQPIDPWGNPYVYANNGGSIELKSLGANGQPGGEALNADIEARR